MANRFIIEIRTQGFNKATGDLDNLKKKTDQYGKSSKKMRLHTAGLRREIGKLRNNLLLATFAFGSIATAIGKSVAAYRKQIEAETRLRASLRNVATASADGADKLIQLAAALQKTTTFGDEQIISGQAMLATFQLNEDSIAALTPRMLDMAAAMGTGGEGLTTIALQLGKAFTGQVGALSRSGVLIDKAGLAAARASGPMEEFAFLATELDKNFSGVAVALGETTIGQIDKIKNSISDLNEEFGKSTVGMQKFGYQVLESLSFTGVFWAKFWDKFAEASKDLDAFQYSVIDIAREAFKETRDIVNTVMAEIEFGLGIIPPALQRTIDSIKEASMWWRLVGYDADVALTQALDKTDDEIEALANMNPLLQKQLEIGAALEAQKQINAAFTEAAMKAENKGLALTIEQRAKLLNLQIKSKQVDEAIFQAQLKGYANLAGSLSSLASQFKHGAKVAARLAQAGAIIDMYAGANKAFKQGGVFGFVTGAAIIASGLANLAQIEAQLSSISSAARGADFITSGPQMMMVGENPGGMERVQVTPLSSPNINGPQGSSITINISGGIIQEDYITNELLPAIDKAKALA